MEPIQTQFVAKGSHDIAKYEPFAIGSIQWIRRPGEGERESLSCGFWQATPEDGREAFEVIYERDETVVVLEGAVRIEPVVGEAFTLRAGDAASFNAGYKCSWTVLEPVREYFVYS